MALETGTFINSLNASNPVATDGLAQADDHMRLIKSTILASFPSITGAVNATHTEINTVADGNTAATSTTLVDADRVPVNDDGTMVQVALSDFKTYMNSNITTINGLTYPTSDGTNGQVMTTNGSVLCRSKMPLRLFRVCSCHMAAPQNPLGGCFVRAGSQQNDLCFVYSTRHDYGTGDGSTTLTCLIYAVASSQVRTTWGRPVLTD